MANLANLAVGERLFLHMSLQLVAAFCHDTWSSLHLAGFQAVIQRRPRDFLGSGLWFKALVQGSGNCALVGLWSADLVSFSEGQQTEGYSEKAKRRFRERRRERTNVLISRYRTGLVGAMCHYSN